ncbi:MULTISPECIES: type IA DNA topoisomerase [Clostridium]|uniref:DNA topoisomerase n=1 Tax=Clostridium faecium TaxID=2762223 RepID=A0ABR8YRE4_9CLOT|nr:MULTISPECIES: DNA topoisomerase [Clostridium]MBD8046822.1 type IA DNA topoisomerase [Clostridium faecium]MDU1348672.1 DNA topoisomerase [Clostridium argentinense]
MKSLILAEKPSVARNIAEALNCKTKRDGYIEGEEYIITWAFGHLLTLYDCKDYDSKLALWSFENFPYIPENFKYKVKPDVKNRNKEDSGAKKQLNIIKSLIERNDVERIISSTDYDREGEVIALLIFNHINVKKPIYRLLLNEWTEEEVRKGLEKLKPNEEMKYLQDAGVSRQLTDWVIGINFTSVATMKYCRGKGNLLNIGRVLMPTLKMVYDRDIKIEKFKAEKYYELYGEFENDKGSYKGKFFHNKLDKFPKKESVEKLKKEIENKEGTIIEKKVEIKKDYIGPLFNLTNLQGYITSKYKGYTADKVLKIAQSLYEKKHITYPRTSSIALEESLKDKAKKVLEVVKKGLPFEDEIKFNTSKKVFNNEKVESHSAIIPTYVLPKNLPLEEKQVYEAIKNRFIAQFMEPAEFEHTEIVTCIKGEKYDRLFSTKGKILIKDGYLKVENYTGKDELLPKVHKGDIVQTVELKIECKKTKPPAHHTEKTLLKAMETCGKSANNNNEEDEDNSSVLSGYSIGTAATRAEIINKLKFAGYINSKGKSLLITEKGKKLIETFPIKELLDTDYTGRMEKALADMEKGKASKDKFLNYIYKFTREGVNKIKNHRAELICDTRE